MPMAKTNELILWLLEGDPAIRWQTTRDLQGMPAKRWQTEQQRTSDPGLGREVIGITGA